MKTLNTQYQLIKEGKGHKGVFLKEAKQQFPQWIRNAATYKETTQILKNKGVINENVIGLEPVNQLVSPPKESYEVAFENYLEEAKKKKETGVKAEEKDTSKSVKDNQDKNFDRKNMDDPNNLIFDQVMKGYYTEMKNPKNCKKTMDELKKIVFKNLTKNPIYYTEKGQFGEDGIGYETELPGLGTPKEPKGPYKSSGYGTLKENQIQSKPSDSPEDPRTNPILLKNQVIEELMEMNDTSTKMDLLSAANDLDFSTLTINQYNARIESIDGEHSTDTIEILESVINIIIDNFKRKNNNSLSENKLRKVINNLIREEFEGEGKDIYSLHTNKGHWTIPNKHVDEPKDIEDYLLDVEGMSKAEAIDYLGDQGLSSSMILRIINQINYDVRDMFGQDPEVKLYSRSNGDSSSIFEVESKLRKVINTLVKQQIQENVQKELQQIDKEAQSEILASKLEKIEAAIDKRQSQLDRLDEDEDLKNLTDKKKLKAIAKDIKVLGKAKSKIEKELAKKDKSTKPQPEVIDGDGIIDEAEGDVDDAKLTADEMERAAKAAKEIGDTELFEEDDVTDEDADEYFYQQEKDAENGVDKGETSTNYADKTPDEPSEEYLEAKEEAESRYEEGEEIESIIKDYPEFKEMLFHDLKGKFEGSDN